MLWRSMAKGKSNSRHFWVDLCALGRRILLGARATLPHHHRTASRPGTCSGRDCRRHVAFSACRAGICDRHRSCRQCWLVLPAFCLPGLLIASLFTLIIPVGVNERIGILAALRRNFSLIGKVFGGAFLITFVSVVVTAGVIVLRTVTIDPFLPYSSVTSFVLRYAIPYVPALLLMAIARGIYPDLCCGPARGTTHSVFPRSSSSVFHRSSSAAIMWQSFLSSCADG